MRLIEVVLLYDGEDGPVSYAKTINEEQLARLIVLDDLSGDPDTMPAITTADAESERG